MYHAVPHVRDARGVAGFPAERRGAGEHEASVMPLGLGAGRGRSAVLAGGYGA